MTTKQNPHYVTLNALYELYHSNKNNKEVLDRLSSIGWALGQDLGFPDGFFELSELIEYGDSASNSVDHYVEVIEKSLKNLESSPWETRLDTPR